MQTSTIDVGNKFMEQVALSALEVNPSQLQVIGLALLALAIVLLAYFNSRSTNGQVSVMQALVKSNTDLTAVTSKQTEALRREQDLREAQITASKAITDAVQSHDGRSDERAEKLLNKIDGITDLVGEKVSAGTERVMEALQPLTEGLKEIKASLEAAKEESRENQRKQAEFLSAIEVKVEMVSEQFIDVIQVFGEMSDENEHAVVDGGIALGELVSVGSDASGGAGGDSSSGSGAAVSGNNGAIA
jgi:hypothetical protein